ncbi:hypothetical protein niasHS_000975 [Heterodera schachtii]|uniref:Uncharacterized protein n=1 Tax=Heterodera schachtii TaxID=97005 RepID=A0ABD2K7V2_HETSC
MIGNIVQPDTRPLSGVKSMVLVRTGSAPPKLAFEEKRMIDYCPVDFTSDTFRLLYDVKGRFFIHPKVVKASTNCAR